MPQNNPRPPEPKLEDFPTYAVWDANWQAWFNIMKGMGLL